MKIILFLLSLWLIYFQLLWQWNVFACSPTDFTPEEYQKIWEKNIEENFQKQKVFIWQVIGYKREEIPENSDQISEYKIKVFWSWKNKIDQEASLTWRETLISWSCEINADFSLWYTYIFFVDKDYSIDDQDNFIGYWVHKNNIMKFLKKMWSPDFVYSQEWLTLWIDLEEFELIEDKKNMFKDNNFIYSQDKIIDFTKPEKLQKLKWNIYHYQNHILYKSWDEIEYYLKSENDLKHKIIWEYLFIQADNQIFKFWNTPAEKYEIKNLKDIELLDYKYSKFYEDNENIYFEEYQEEENLLISLSNTLDDTQGFKQIHFTSMKKNIFLNFEKIYSNRLAHLDREKKIQMLKKLRNYKNPYTEDHKNFSRFKIALNFLIYKFEQEINSWK